MGVFISDNTTSLYKLAKLMPNFESSEMEFVAWEFWEFECLNISVLTESAGQFCLSSLKDYFGSFWLRA